MKTRMSNIEKTIEQFSIIFQKIGYGITVQDKKGRLIYINNDAAHMSGYSSPREMLMTPPEKIFSKITLWDKEGKPMGMNDLPGRFAMEDKKTHETLIHYKFNNKEKDNWSLVRAIPVLKGREIEFIVNTIQDMTEEKHEADRMDYFIAIAGHEFKTPLTNIKALSQLLERRFQTKNYKDINNFLNKIQVKVDSLTKIINNFLDMTKIRAGKLEFSHELFDFNSLIDETIRDFQEIVHSHRIIKKGKIKKLVFLDKQKLNEVIINLFINAAKYSPGKKKIIITITARKNSITVCIKDFGIGIAKKYHEQIFEPFFRAPEKQYKASGLGIGLFISSQIVRMLGGAMWVKSLLGKGATFCFRLPYKAKKRIHSFTNV